MEQSIAGSTQIAQECAFCRELSTGYMPSAYVALAGIQQRVIRRTQNFVALPSVTPITPGHVLILPVMHVTSFSQLPQFLNTAFMQFCAEVVDHVSSQFGTVFYWEHGVGYERSGGCGVTHAHLHVMPLGWGIKKRLHQFLTEVLPSPEQVAFANLRERAGRHNSYLYWGFSEGGSFASLSEQIPSQLVRQKAASLLGSTTWDWRALTHWDYFLETFESLEVPR